MNSKEALREAVRRAGSKKALACDLGVTPQTVSRYEKEKVPPARAVQIERITGVSRDELRPDIFKREA